MVVGARRYRLLRGLAFQKKPDGFVAGLTVLAEEWDRVEAFGMRRVGASISIYLSGIRVSEAPAGVDCH